MKWLLSVYAGSPDLSNIFSETSAYLIMVKVAINIFSFLSFAFAPKQSGFGFPFFDESEEVEPKRNLDSSWKDS